jgi:hypothetical protein
MGPYSCQHENCGKRTMNDSHLCDEHDPDQQPEPETFRLPRDFYAYEDYCDRRDYRECK